MPIPPIPNPNAAPPGSLAESRVGADTFHQLRRAQSVQFATFTRVPQRQWRIKDTEEWTEQVSSCPQRETTAFLQRFAEMLHDDRLYTADSTGQIGHGDVEVRLMEPLFKEKPHQESARPDLLVPRNRLDVYLKAHRMRFSYERQNVMHSTELLLDPVGQPLLDLIQRCVPGDAAVQALHFRPMPPVAPAPLKGVPADMLAAVRSIRPGMRRTDVLRVLREQGGLTTRLEEEFVYPKPFQEQGRSVKLRVFFAPASARIRWLDGVGYPVSPRTPLAIEDVTQSDIVIQVSEPFVGYRVH